MTWEEKLAALNSLSQCSLRMRKPGDWYVSWHAETGGTMVSCDFGNGRTPEEAVNAHWDLYVTNLPSDRHIRAKNRCYRWVGFMWEEVEYVTAG